MLKLKVLRGLSGSPEFELSDGDNIVGRQGDCDIQIQATGISKKHARLAVQGNRCVLEDLGSSNGTFVNGAPIQNRVLSPGDRIGFYNIICELQIIQDQPSPNPATGLSQPLVQPWDQNAAVDQHHQPSAEASESPSTPPSTQSFFSDYLHKVIMPGVYKLNETNSLQGLLAGSIALFILLVTILSTIPMAELTKEGVQKEGMRRAQTLSRQLADYTERAFQAGSDVAIRTDFVENEEGVNLALVVARSDGHIIAPLTRKHGYSGNEFVARARKSEKPILQLLSDTRVGSSYPVRKYSQDSGQQEVSAVAVVLYDLETVDLSKTVSLFARVLIIAIVLGSLLYFMLYRLFAHPLEFASQQLDQALRGERDSLDSKYEVAPLEDFITNINSALSRMGTESSDQGFGSGPVDRSQEISNLVRLLKEPSFALDGQDLFIQVNSAFEELTGSRFMTLQGQTFDQLQDQALQLNLQDLLSQAKLQPATVVSSELEIGGQIYELDLQVSTESTGDIGYTLGIIRLKEEGAL